MRVKPCVVCANTHSIKDVCDAMDRNLDRSLCIEHKHAMLDMFCHSKKEVGANIKIVKVQNRGTTNVHDWSFNKAILVIRAETRATASEAYDMLQASTKDNPITTCDFFIWKEAGT